MATIALATAPVVLSASDNESRNNKVAQNATAEKVPSTTFATLKTIKAAPMSSSELDAVKGLHFHFLTPAGTILLVNVQKGHDEFSPTPNPDPSTTFPFIVGKGYRGLCGAALNSPGLSIPGQSDTTGVGGGC